MWQCTSPLFLTPPRPCCRAAGGGPVPPGSQQWLPASGAASKGSALAQSSWHASVLGAVLEADLGGGVAGAHHALPAGQQQRRQGKQRCDSQRQCRLTPGARSRNPCHILSRATQCTYDAAKLSHQQETADPHSPCKACARTGTPPPERPIHSLTLPRGPQQRWRRAPAPGSRQRRRQPGQQQTAGAWGPAQPESEGYVSA